MHLRSRSTRLLPALALAVVGALAAPRVAHAQDAGNIDINPFRFAVDSRGYLTVDASQVLGHKELSLGIVTNWGRHLLVFENGDQTFEVTNVVTPTLHGAFGLKLGPAELELAISMPFSIMSGDRNPDDDGGTPTPNDDNKFGLSGQGLGNVGVHLKTRFLKTSKGPKIGLGLILSAFLPTASEKDRFLAEDGLQPAASVILDKEFGKQRNLRFAVNAGIKLHTGTTSWTDTGNGDPGSPATNKTIDSGSAEVPVGVAIAWSIAPQKFDLIGEVFGSLPLGGENYLPLEAIGGVKLYLGKNSFFSLGGGRGLVTTKGANPDLRAFIGIIFEPNIGDRDGDGYKDDVDECPDDPEDFD
ncbi:MAG: hypothetical protein KC464_35025, partial [Myxococcales bacterium]|nr:hypothetical protein [Myxococcales bacterium]